MVSIELTSKDVICRKPHLCVWCGEGIGAGEKAHYSSGVHYGEFHSNYWHPECRAALIASELEFDDEFYHGEQIRGKTFHESHE